MRLAPDDTDTVLYMAAPYGTDISLANITAAAKQKWGSDISQNDIIVYSERYVPGLSRTRYPITGDEGDYLVLKYSPAKTDSA